MITYLWEDGGLPLNKLERQKGRILTVEIFWVLLVICAIIKSIAILFSQIVDLIERDSPARLANVHNT